MNKEKKRQLWDDTIDELKKDKKVVAKYAHAGIYSITINNQLVYIGKSRDMLCRLAQHIFYTNNLFYTKSHKYKIIALAQLMGYAVRFDVLYYSSTLGNVDEEIGEKEGELIRQYLPPLNYQIPLEEDYHHYKVNKSAKTITLMEILGEDK